MSAVVQKTPALTVNAGTGTLTFGSNITAGNSILILLAVDGLGQAPTVSFSDTLSNGYTLDNTYFTAWGSECTLFAYRATGSAGGANTITITGSHAGTIDAQAYELQGLVTSPLDVHPTNSGTGSTAPTISSGTLAQASEVVFALFAMRVGGQSATTPPGFTLGYEDTSGTYQDSLACYVDTTGTGSQTATTTLGGAEDFGALMVSYKVSGGSASFSSNPANIPSNHNGNITLTLTGSGTSWVQGTTAFSISGVANWIKVSQNITSGTAATLVISGPGILPAASSTGTLAVSDGTLTANVAVGTPTLSVSPTSGNSQNTTNLTLTGTYTLWSADHPAWTTSIAGDAINTDAWSSNSAGTAHYVAGATGGNATITDPSTGATAPFTVNTPQPPSAPTIAISTAAGQDTIRVTVASTAGANPIAGYNLYAGTTPGGESATAVTNYTGAGTGSFTPQPTAGAGQTHCYYVRAYDNLGVPTLSAPSREVSSRLTGLVATGATYLRTFVAPYGTAAGGQTIGYTIYDPIGALLVPHTTAGVYELPDASGESGQTGIFIVSVLLQVMWTGTIVWDAPGPPAAGAPFVETFQPHTYAEFENGLAQAGGAQSITLRAAAPANYVDQGIYLYAGAGAGQTNKITSQSGVDCGVESPWNVQPNNTTLYVVLGRIG